MRRTQRRRNTRQHHSNDIDENWSLKSLQHDDHHQRSNLGSSSSAETSTFQPKSHSHINQRRDLKWVPRNRPNHASNKWYVKKSELNFVSPELGSSVSKPTSLDSPKSKTATCLDAEVGSLSDDVVSLSVGERVENKEENGGVETNQKEKDCEAESGVVDVKSILKEL